MSKDTIYRQDAIDALCRRCDLAAEDDEPCTEKCNDIKILEKLPPAQPERICIATVTLTDEQVKEAIEKGIEKAKCEILAAQPEPKKGQWILMSDADGEYYACSECGEDLPRYCSEMPTWDNPYPRKQSIDKTDFCPNCGADMRGEQDE